MAQDLFSKQIEQVQNLFLQKTKAGFNKSVDLKLKNLTKRLQELQQDFFTMLAMKTIGATGAPSLGSFTPSWKPLNDSYTEARAFDKLIGEGEFFRYSGALETALYGMKAQTYFGKPLVLYKRGNFQRQINAGAYKAPGKKLTKEDLQARVQIDLYPKITDSIYDVDEGDLFSNKMVTEKRGNKSYTTPIAYRLKNYKGSRDRPIVSAFMNWWLNTKAKAVIRKATT